MPFFLLSKPAGTGNESEIRRATSGSQKQKLGVLLGAAAGVPTPIFTDCLRRERVFRTGPWTSLRGFSFGCTLMVEVQFVLRCSDSQTSRVSFRELSAISVILFCEWRGLPNGCHGLER
ncbi:hypothetical protein V6N11_050957 [Hibiscus sabdariffa]|uniref:Uncharacterized protein n=1 Tax=Hibiscus sabdariffa TaxID=183260 RepID=A0ABR2R2F0_9ROSI